MESKEPLTSLDVVPDRPRKSSITDTIAAGFETANVLRGPAQPNNQGQNSHGSSTTFASKGFDQHYKPSDGWEGLHRYDPDFTWEPSEERRLVRKVSNHRMAHFMSYLELTLHRLTGGYALSRV